MAEGSGFPLEEAFKDAWGKVPRQQKGKVHIATKIQCWGNNPINGYRVILSPTQEDAPS
jgi:hypothetical protein